MVDNTTLPGGSGGDTIRTLDKTGAGIPKTEVVGLDIGGADGRSEFLASFPLPAALSDVSVDEDHAPTFSLSASTLDAVEMLFRQTIAASGYPQTTAESLALVTPTNQIYAPGNVVRYGADPTGVIDSTAAFNSALFQRQKGGEKIVFPAGLYKGNFIVTGQNVVIEAQEPFYEDLNTVGFIAGNTANPVWQVGDGVSLTSSIYFRGAFKLHGLKVASKGLYGFGATNVWFDNLIVRGFTTWSFNYTASTTQFSSYWFINNYRIDVETAGAIGFVTSQPANYPTSYATALFLSNGALSNSAATPGLWSVQINANCKVWVNNSFWSMVNNAGINFTDAAGTGSLVCNNLAIDTLGTVNDVLVTSAYNAPLNTVLNGFYTINGKVSINGVVSTTTLQGGSGYFAYRVFLAQPSVISYIDFQDGNAAFANQTVYAQQAMNLSRTGGNFNIINTVGGSVISQAASYLFFNGGATADAPLQFGQTGIQVVTGAGAPAISDPVGTLFLRSDGGAGTSVYTKDAGTGTTGWVPIGRGVIPLRATAIETRTSTTTLTNSTQLTYAIPAAGTYAFELVVFTYFSTAVTDGITANVNYSGTFTAVGSYLTGFVMNGTTTTTGIQPVEISATVNNALAGLTLATYGASVTSAAPACHVLKGNLIATATGTLAFAFAQSTTGIDTTNLGVGSYMTVTQLS